MFCHRCGQTIQPHYQYCPRCGVSLPAAATPGKSPRMDAHVKALGVLYILYNIIGLIGSVGLLLALTAVGNFLANLIGAAPDTQQLIRGLIGSLGVVMVLESLAGLFAGFGLLEYQSWARPLTIILSLINLLHFPLGTALGLYGLWVLISAEGERHYRQMTLAIG